jgi:hypothetical protein
MASSASHTSKLKPSGTFAASSGEAIYYNLDIVRINVTNKNDCIIIGANHYFASSGNLRKMTGDVIILIADRYNKIYQDYNCTSPKELSIKITNDTKFFIDGVSSNIYYFQKHSNEKDGFDIVIDILFRIVDYSKNKRSLIVIANKIAIKSRPIDLSSIPDMPAAYYPIVDELPTAYYPRVDHGQQVVPSTQLESAPRPAYVPATIASRPPIPVSAIPSTQLESAPRPAYAPATIASPKIKTHKLKYIETNTYHIESLKEEYKSCSICLEKVIIDGCVTKCFHLFHKTCIENWMLHSNICPNCGV